MSSQSSLLYHDVRILIVLHSMRLNFYFMKSYEGPQTCGTASDDDDTRRRENTTLDFLRLGHLLVPLDRQLAVGDAQRDASRSILRPRSGRGHAFATFGTFAIAIQVASGTNASAIARRPTVM